MGRPEDGEGAAEGRPAAGSTVEGQCGRRTPAPSGQEGELRVKSPQLMLGYTDPTLAADAFDDRGRFRTGDPRGGRAERVVRITGRLKDIIIRKMENVSPRRSRSCCPPIPRSPTSQSWAFLTNTVVSGCAQ